MQLISLIKTAICGAALLAIPAAAMEKCMREGGEPRGECVKYYKSRGCNQHNMIDEFRPNCDMKCTRVKGDGAMSVEVAGDGRMGTMCVMYMDDHCRMPMDTTGVVIYGPGMCKVMHEPARSMMCSFGC